MTLVGKLTSQQIALITNLVEVAGKLEGASSYIRLGDLMAAIRQFKPEEPATEPELPLGKENEK